MSGIEGAARWVIAVFGLKGACHVGLLLLAPAAVLALFGRRPSRAASAAAASTALLAAMGLVAGGILVCSLLVLLGRCSGSCRPCRGSRWSALP